MAALPLFGISFLENLLELVQFLAQLRERLLRGIGFLSAFLGGTEIGFFCSVFLKTTTIASTVRHVRAPMLLAQVAMFLGTYLFRDSEILSGRFVPFFLLCEGFSSQEGLDLLDPSCPHARSIASRD